MFRDSRSRISCDTQRFRSYTLYIFLRIDRTCDKASVSSKTSTYGRLIAFLFCDRQDILNGRLARQRRSMNERSSKYRSGKKCRTCFKCKLISLNRKKEKKVFFLLLRTFILLDSFCSLIILISPFFDCKNSNLFNIRQIHIK